MLYHKLHWGQNFYWGSPPPFPLLNRPWVCFLGLSSTAPWNYDSKIPAIFSTYKSLAVPTPMIVLLLC